MTFLAPMLSLALIGFSPVHADEDPNLRDHAMDETEAGFCADCEAELNPDDSDCNSKTPGPICQIQKMLKQQKVTDTNTSLLRSAASRLDYIRNYQNCKHPEGFRGYKNRYRIYTSDAASVFGVPQALLECLIFQESQWDANARSATGAFGFGQFTENTAKMIDGFISAVPTIPDGRKEIKQLQDSLDTGTKNKDLKGMAFYRARIRNRQLNIGWMQYFNRLRDKKLWSGPAPTKFSKMKDGKTASVAIGAVALLASYHYSVMINQPGYPPVKTQEELVNLLAVVGGFHNRGAGRLADRLGRYPPKTYAGWIKKLGEGDPEAKKHMENIRRCVHKDGGPPLEQTKRGAFVEQTPAECREENR